MKDYKTNDRWVHGYMLAILAIVYDIFVTGVPAYTISKVTAIVILFILLFFRVRTIERRKNEDPNDL